MTGTREAVEVLREIEWNGSAWIGLHTCPMCGNEEYQGHMQDCDVGRVLTEVVQEFS